MSPPFPPPPPPRPEIPANSVGRSAGAQPMAAGLFSEEPLVQPFPPSPYDEPQTIRPATQSLFFRPIPYMPPLGTSPSSVITSHHPEQTKSERPMAPPNRSPLPLTTGPHFPLTPPAAQPPSPWQGSSPPPPPAPPGGWSSAQLSSREFAQLRLEMRSEIEQVRNDVFGAATGVSAVRDRLDGLELRLAKLEQAAAAAETAPRMEDWQEFIDHRIQQGLHDAFSQAPGTSPPRAAAAPETL